MTAFAVPEVPARAGWTVAKRPTEAQRQRIKEILGSCPGLAEGGELVLIYVPGRAAETSWLCAQARAAGVPVRLAAVRPVAQTLQRKARAAVSGAATLIVLADMTLDLPPGAVQLAGTERISPIDWWCPLSELTQRAQELARRLPSPLLLRTGDTTIDLRIGPWQAAGGAAQAEVATAHGVFTADSAIMVNRPVSWDARLAGRTVTLTVQDGLVVDVRCQDAQLCRLLDRAVRTHLANRVTAVRAGAHPVACGFSAVPGPVNIVHPGVTLRLGTGIGHPCSSASAGLCLDLTATWEEAPR